MLRKVAEVIQEEFDLLLALEDTPPEKLGKMVGAELEPTGFLNAWCVCP